MIGYNTINIPDILGVHANIITAVTTEKSFVMFDTNIYNESI